MLICASRLSFLELQVVVRPIRVLSRVHKCQINRNSINYLFQVHLFEIISWAIVGLYDASALRVTRLCWGPPQDFSLNLTILNTKQNPQNLMMMIIYMLTRKRVTLVFLKHCVKLGY